MINVVIIGATGYAGENVEWILCNLHETKIYFLSPLLKINVTTIRSNIRKHIESTTTTKPTINI